MHGTLPSTTSCDGDVFRYANDAAQVREFCETHGIVDLADSFLALAHRHFKVMETIVSVESDSTGDDDWLEVDVFVQGSPQDVLTAYKSFVVERDRLVPEDKLTLLRVAYHIR